MQRTQQALWPETEGSVVKLSPQSSAARDEGPRLILLDVKAEEPGIPHYMELAEVALKARSMRAKKKKGCGNE